VVCAALTTLPQGERKTPSNKETTTLDITKSKTQYRAVARLSLSPAFRFFLIRFVLLSFFKMINR
jgi:hypothetical protein